MLLASVVMSHEFIAMLTVYSCHKLGQEHVFVNFGVVHDF